MPISPFLPFIGLAVIVGNIVLAAVRPQYPPTVMGVQLFIGGMTTILVAVVDVINPIGIPEYERVLLFITGCINCSIGYYMALLEIYKRGA